MRKLLSVWMTFGFIGMVLTPMQALASQYIGDLVYCDAGGVKGEFEPGLGDFELNGVTVNVVCTAADGRVCASRTTTTGTLHPSVNVNMFNSRCSEVATFDPNGDLSGRYVVEVLGSEAIPGCLVPETFPSPINCEVRVDESTLPPECRMLVTPLAGDPPSDGNSDGDFCDPEDGPFPEGQILGGSSLSQDICETFPSGPPGNGVHLVELRSAETSCSLFNDFGYMDMPDPCQIDVQKGCVIPPPPSSGDDCDGKVTEAVFEYTGANCGSLGNSQGDKAKCEGDLDGLEPVSAEYTGKDPNKFTLSPDSGINVGDTFTLTATGRRDFHANTKIEIAGGTQALEIHTSCSTPLAVGDVFGGLTLVELTTTEGGTATLPSGGDSGDLAQECEIVAGRPGSCADGKPSSLTFTYTGDSCAEGVNGQDKDECSGDPMDANGVSIVVTADQGDVTVSPSSGINVGDMVTFTATGDRLKSTLRFDVVGGASDQSLNIHTSCSDVLIAGDQFGSMLLEQYVPEGGASPSDGRVDYVYQISHSGSGDVVVDVFDDQLGEIASGLVVGAGETVELIESTMLTETTTNIVTVTDNAEQCAEDSAEVTVTAVVPPASCEDGKPQELVFEYTGDSCAEGINGQSRDSCSGDPMDANGVSIVITKDAAKVSATPSSGINVGDLVTISTTESRFGAETKLDVAGGAETQSLNIHTSCSNPLVVGDQFGSLLLRVFVPEN